MDGGLDIGSNYEDQSEWTLRTTLKASDHDRMSYLVGLVTSAKAFTSNNDIRQTTTQSSTKQRNCEN